MLQNIIAYTVILIFYSAPAVPLGLAYYYFKKGKMEYMFRCIAASIIILMAAGWIATLGQAYHTRTMNEAKKEFEINAKSCGSG